ncbi:MAG: hypothetical protein R3E39_29210 [Anaerolineae bacterium]
MLCMNNYESDYINECRTRVQAQLTAYRTLVAAASKHDDQPLNTAFTAFEPVFFNNMVLLLDQLFVHRSRALEIKDGNPLNEVRVLCNSLLTNNGKLVADKQIKLSPAKSVLGYKVGDEINLSEEDFIRLSGAFFLEIEKKFLLVEPMTA